MKLMMKTFFSETINTVQGHTSINVYNSDCVHSLVYHCNKMWQIQKNMLTTQHR